MIVYKEEAYKITGAAFKVYNETYKADFVCFGKIIVELKAVSTLDDAHRSQVYNYLHATNYKLGLLLNFGCPDELEYERKVL